MGVQRTGDVEDALGTANWIVAHRYRLLSGVDANLKSKDFYTF